MRHASGFVMAYAAAILLMAAMAAFLLGADAAITAVLR